MHHAAELPEHGRRHRGRWDARAAEYVGLGERAWARQEPTWGIWWVADSEPHVLPEDLAGKDVIELGCGTAYISAGRPRLGARVVGMDNSAAPMATAHRPQREHGLTFTLIHAHAGPAPYPEASFDRAISAYGACVWADPPRRVPEAAHLLRPCGARSFLVHSAPLTRCMPEEDSLAASDRLRRPAFWM